MNVGFKPTNVGNKHEISDVAETIRRAAAGPIQMAVCPSL
jgi:hypothetical protein